jgi:DNA-binding NtrC family response regulator
MLRIALERWGYQVLHAAGAGAARDLARAHRKEIGVVLCDVVLPDAPGPEALAAIHRQCPSARVVFTSGYPFDVLVERGLISMELLRAWNAFYLPKPFLPEDVHVLVGAAFRELEESRERAAIGCSFLHREAYAASAH